MRYASNVMASTSWLNDWRGTAPRPCYEGAASLRPRPWRQSVLREAAGGTGPRQSKLPLKYGNGVQ